MKGSCIRLEKAQVKAWLHEFKTPYLNMVRNWFKILAGLPLITRFRGLSHRFWPQIHLFCRQEASSLRSVAPEIWW